MSSSNLMDRARALAGSTAVAALPLAVAVTPASAFVVEPAGSGASLQHGYSVVGEYSNSGWFMSWLDDAAASASVLGNGFKLSGTQTITDSLFWRWDDNAQATLRRYDVTGFAFAWGGAINGALRSGDMLSAPFDFLLDYTHTLPQFAAFDYFGVNWSLKIGLRADGYVPEFYQPVPSNNNTLTYAETYGSVDVAGQFGFQGSLGVPVDDWTASQATHWFAVLTVDWNDALAQRGYEDTHGSHNGDTLTFTVPDNSIDLTIVQGKTTLAGEILENSGTYTAPSWSVFRTAGTFRNLAGGLLRIEGTAEIADGGTISNAFGGTVQNAGTLRALFGGVMTNSGVFDNESGASIENSGTLRNLLGGVLGGAGSVTNNSDGVIENAGLLRMLGGASFSNYGKFDNLAGAEIEVEGSMDNLFGGLMGNAGRMQIKTGGSLGNSGTLLNALGGLMTNGGTVSNQSSGVFGNIGTLTNALGGMMFNSGRFTNSSSNTVNNEGYFYSDGLLENTETGTFNNDGTLEIGGGTFVNDGLLNNAGSIVNWGSVAIGTTGRVTGAGTYEQWYGHTRVDGELSATQIALHGGTLAGSGVVTATAALSMDEGVTIAPGGEDEAGTLTIHADFLADPTGVLLVDIDGPNPGAQHDVLAIDGIATLAGDLHLDIGYTPAPGAVFTILTATGGVAGQFGNVVAGPWQVAIQYGADSVTLQLGAPVPEPGTYAMFLAGLGLLALWRQRRR